MSARLIKGGDGAGVTAYMPFAMPAVTTDGAPQPHRPPAQPHQLPAADFAGFGADNAAAFPALANEGAAANESHDEAAAEIDAGALVAEAQAEAERLLAGARTGAAEVERQARERGMAEARAHAEGEIARLVEPLRAQFAESLDEVAALREHLAAQAEREMVRLAVEIAKKIVQREVTMDAEITLTLARVALSRINSRTVAIVRLNPEDFAYVNARRDRLGANVSVEIVSDASVGRGGCLVETESGDVDARIEQQFAEIERSLLGT